MVAYENFVFVLGSEDRENVYFVEQDRDLIIQETSLETHITDVINRFVRTGRVGNILENLQYLRKLLMI